jgi:hypothetical protein
VREQNIAKTVIVETEVTELMVAVVKITTVEASAVKVLVSLVWYYYSDVCGVLR